MEQDYWLDIVFEVAPHNQPTEQNERMIEAVIRGFRRHAHQRAIRGFVAATGTRHRYLHDAEFHYKVDVLAQTFVAGVFNDMPLTKAEQQERIKLLEGLVADLDGIRLEP